MLSSMKFEFMRNDFEEKKFIQSETPQTRANIFKRY